MRVLLFILILGVLLLGPFVVLRRPWAVRVWRRVKFFVVLYVAVIFGSAVYWLVMRWDEFYG